VKVGYECWKISFSLWTRKEKTEREQPMLRKDKKVRSGKCGQLVLLLAIVVDVCHSMNKESPKKESQKRIHPSIGDHGRVVARKKYFPPSPMIKNNK
jgi:hypothetical protein